MIFFFPRFCNFEIPSHRSIEKAGKFGASSTGDDATDAASTGAADANTPYPAIAAPGVIRARSRFNI